MNTELIMLPARAFAAVMNLQTKYFGFPEKNSNESGPYAAVRSCPLQDLRNTVLDNFILRIIDVYDMPDWKESLAEFMKERMEG